MKEKSPLFFMDDEKKVISLPLDFNCGASCGTSEQGLQKIFDQAEPAIAAVVPSDEERRTDVVSYEEREKVLSFVMNESALTQDARAWPWHYRFGHLAFRDVAKLGLGFTKAPNCDCAICDKKGFKRVPYHRKPEYTMYTKPPYRHVSMDGFGGQESYGCKSYRGAEEDLCSHVRAPELLTSSCMLSVDSSRDYSRCTCMKSWLETTRSELSAVIATQLSFQFLRWSQFCRVWNYLEFVQPWISPGKWLR